jgi:predicted unusual protein kinase regulating ubiquinone biosynthesis (AarF/ABC1/UbiB family)
VNYLRYYSGKIVDSGLTRDKLDEDNAEDIYDGLKTLKGSALKVAQMLSMDKVFCLKHVEILFVAIFCSTTFSSISP